MQNHGQVRHRHMTWWRPLMFEQLELSCPNFELRIETNKFVFCTNYFCIQNVFQFPIMTINTSVLLYWRADGTNQNSETTNLWNPFERLTRLSVCASPSLYNSYIIFSAVNQPVWHCHHGDCVFTDGRSPSMGAPPCRNKRAQRSRKQAARSLNEDPSQLQLPKQMTKAINTN